MGIEGMLRTYERKEIHRTWHSKVSGRGSAATVGGRQIVPARGHAACPALRGSTWRASTGPGEVRHRHLLGRNHYRQTEVPCQAKARLRGRTTAPAETLDRPSPRNARFGAVAGYQQTIQ